MTKDNEFKKTRTSKKQQECIERHLRENDLSFSRAVSRLSDDEPHQAVVELMTDMMHFCHRKGLRFPVLLDEARTDFILMLNDELEGSIAAMAQFKNLFTAVPRSEARDSALIVQNLE